MKYALTLALSVIVVSFFLIFVLNPSFNILGFSVYELLWVLLIPIVVDAPQTFAKGLILLYGRNTKPTSTCQLKLLPQISVIIPAHNEGEYIQNTLESVLEDPYPNKEVIVVDDGSTDATYVKAMMYADNQRVRVIRREKASGTKARAVNYGFVFTKGEIIIVIDGDTLVERGAIQKIIEPLHTSDDAIAVAGNVRVVNKVNLLTRLQAYEYLCSMELGRRWQSLFSGILVIPGAFGAFRREVFESLGRMHPDTITEDFDLTVMLQKVRKRLVFAPEAVAWTHAPEDWRGWIRQRVRWAVGQIQVYRKHLNILFRRRFGLFGLFIVPNSIFMDVVALLLRFGWGIYIIASYTIEVLLKLSLVIFAFYLFLEFFTILFAAALTPRREDVKYAILAPIMVIFYRPLYSIVRLWAYLKAFLGRRVRW
jgi:cellulose synthase/poly-beta-1,6-N-acetylglucosamine synthase-like glycosyltransferase